MALWQEWWVWMVAGAALAIAEVLLPGFILLGFAIGAVLTGALIWLGLLGAGVPVTVLAFAVFSLLAWAGLRRFVGVREGQVRHLDRDINDN